MEGGQHHTPAGFTSVKEPVPNVQETGWAPGTVWTGAQDLAPTGIRFPDRPARSESLYQLCCIYTVSLCMFDCNKSVTRLPVHPSGFKPTASDQSSSHTLKI